MANSCTPSRVAPAIGQVPIQVSNKLLRSDGIDVKNRVVRAVEGAASVARIARVELQPDLPDIVGHEAGDARLRLREVQGDLDPRVFHAEGQKALDA